MKNHLHCPYCGCRPHEIDEYVEQARDEEVTPDQYVRIEEGTYSRKHNVFTCTSCYINIGMPLNKDLFQAYGHYLVHLENESKKAVEVE